MATKRGPYRSTVKRRLAQAIDRQLIDLLANGEVVADRTTGAPLIDENGQPIRKPPSAALITAAIRRLSDLRQSGEDGKPDPLGEALAKAQAEAQARHKEPQP